MRSLVDFLNHGILPFVGRAVQTERIVTFWRGTADAHGMRAALLVGEAGVGKSRLVEEVIPTITAAGGAVVHARLYPDTTTSIAPILARALWLSAAGRKLLSEQPEERLDAVAGSLRRIARLRPLLLVVEDIHLLRAQPLQEFSLLLEMIADENLSILCLSRPVELAAQGVLERWLVDEIELQGIDREESAALWREMFGSPAVDEILGALLANTFGNPLAIRSALRCVVVSGALAPDYDGCWRLGVPIELFTAMLERNVGALSEGMTAHLGDDEREAAERLACLGEIFSLEAAQVVIERAEKMLTRLLFKGVIVTSRSSAPPLYRAVSAHPQYAFTHTVLHWQSVQRATPDLRALIRAIGDDLPLYSMLPFRLIEEGTIPGGLPLADVERAVRRMLSVAHQLDNGPDWELALHVWNAAVALVNAYADDWSEEERVDMRGELFHYRLMLRRREDQSDEFRAEVEQYLALCDDPAAERMARHGLLALVHLNRSEHRRRRAGYREIWERVERIVRAFPTIGGSRAYVAYLRDVAAFTRVAGSTEMTRLVEEKLEEIVTSEHFDEEFRCFARGLIVPQILPMFDTPEMLTHRLRMLADLESLGVKDDTALQLMKVELLERSGRMEEAFHLCDRLLPRLEERGLLRNYHNYSLVRLGCLLALGAEPEQIGRSVDELLATAPGPIRVLLRQELLRMMPTLGLLRGLHSWARGIVERYREPGERLSLEIEVLLMAGADRGGAIESLLGGEILGERRLQRALLAVIEGDARDLARDESVRALLSHPIVRPHDLLPLRAVIVAAEQSPEIATALEGEIHGALSRALEWLAERRLAALMEATLADHERWFRKLELRQWRKRIEEIGGIVLPAARRVEEEVIELTMIGVIAVTRSDGPAARVRGGRLRAVLGLMVADRLLDVPLGHREFCRIAAGGEEDQEHARKILNVTVHRLRELLGHEAIDTDGPTPRLDLDRVRVDLLGVARLIDQASHAARRGSLLRALPALRSALEQVRGEVPFPTLYDEFFEAAREDFECRLRSAVVDVCRGVLMESDLAGAEELLRLAGTVLPGDEELSELLCQVLGRVGKQAEAALVRMGSEEL